jgi:SAM-dependent methyltransferase
MTSLLGYPLLVEPSLTLWHQTAAWAAGFATFALLLIACIFTLKSSGGLHSTTQDNTQDTPQDRSPAPSTKEIARWIGLSALPSSLLLGVTTHITTDVAPMPMLWILPLALYLATFIIVFANWDHKHQRRVQLFSASLVLPALGFLLLKPAIPAIALLLLYITIFASLTLTFHGKLALEKPAPEHLTLFFLCMSIGGAAGGLFNGLFAPLLLNHFIELHIALLLASLVIAPHIDTLMLRDATLRRRLNIALPVSMITCILLCISQQLTPQLALGVTILSALVGRLLSLSTKRAWKVMAAALIAAQVGSWQLSDTLHRERSFFANHRVHYSADTDTIDLSHGTTVHGTQSRDPALRQQALTYYHPAGPAGQVMRTLRWPTPPRIAMLGLGAGALAAYCRGGITCDFFEIDPVVVKLARQQFTYLSDCGTPCSVEIGDGRLLIEAKPLATYDIIVLDAYSSDAVPVHLITQEALDIYKSRIKKDGILLLHLSNRYLDLRPVLATLAHHANMHTTFINFTPSDADRKTQAGESAWAVMANEAITIQPLLDRGWQPLTMKPGEPLWTDDFSNILPILSRNGTYEPR